MTAATTLDAPSDMLRGVQLRGAAPAPASVSRWT